MESRSYFHSPFSIKSISVPCSNVAPLGSIRWIVWNYLWNWTSIRHQGSAKAMACMHSLFSRCGLIHCFNWFNCFQAFCAAGQQTHRFWSGVVLDCRNTWSIDLYHSVSCNQQSMIATIRVYANVYIWRVRRTWNCRRAAFLRFINNPDREVMPHHSPSMGVSTASDLRSLR